MPRPQCVQRPQTLGCQAGTEAGSEEKTEEKVGGRRTKEKAKGRKASGRTKTRPKKEKRGKERMHGRRAWTREIRQQSEEEELQAASKSFWRIGRFGARFKGG